MAVNQDRMKTSFWALVKAALPRVDYYALRVARVVSQSKDLTTVDLLPDDPRFPSMAGVPLRVTPGTSIQLGNGSTVLLGFSEGDPARPFAAILAGGDVAKAITIQAATLNLGGPGATPTVVEAYRTAEAALNTAIAGLATTAAGASIDPAAATFFGALATLLTNFETPTTALTYLSANAKVK
ncbi:MAG TPA: hypothetical protein VFG23_05450 [Polyangia bacterium]|nr:hypothetical protein [Polyangia bacterium]